MEPVNVVSSYKEQFETAFTTKLTASFIGGLIKKSIPLDTPDQSSVLKDPTFNEGFQSITEKIAAKHLGPFQKMQGGSPATSFLDTTVGVIKEHVAAESQYRFDAAMAAIESGKIDTSKIGWDESIESSFTQLGFSSKEIETRFKSTVQGIMTTEQEALIDSIKSEVSDSIEQTADKNKLVQATLNELKDQKNDLQDELNDELGGDEDAEGSASSNASNGPEPKSEGAAVPDDGNNGNPAPDAQPAGDNGSGGSGDQTPQTDEVTETLPVDPTGKPDETPEVVAESLIPVTPRSLQDTRKYTRENLTSLFIRSAGKIDDEVKTRLKVLKSAISLENNTEALEEYEELEEKTTEALSLANHYAKSLESIGVTSHGLFRKNDIFAVESAKNFIQRFIKKSKYITIVPPKAPITSTEGIVNQAFDVLQMRQDFKAGKLPASAFKDLAARESLLFTSLDAMDQKTKAQAASVLQLTDIKIDKILANDFIDNTAQVLKDITTFDKAPSNEGIVDSVAAKLKNYVMRELTDEEIGVIRATAYGEDVTEIMPTPYEKFVIKFTKSAMKKSTESVNLPRIEFKARLYTTIYKTLESLGMLDKEDITAVDQLTLL